MSFNQQMSPQPKAPEMSPQKQGVNNQFSPQPNTSYQQQQGSYQQAHEIQDEKADYLWQQKDLNEQNLQQSVVDLNQFYTQQLGVDNLNPNKSDHPTLALCQFVLKAAPVLCYFFLGWFVTRQWTVPEVIIVLSSVDFWLTKNVAGRLLVGLRWWEEVDEATGKQLWVFECKVNEGQTKKVNEGIFWVTQYSAFIAWAILAVLNILTISILNLVGIGFSLITNGTNIYFFYKCSRVQKVRAKQLAQVLGAQMLNKMVTTSVIWPLQQPHRKGK